MELIKASNNQTKTKIKELYFKAFPKQEQKPFWLLWYNQKRGLTNIYSIEESHKFLGLAVVTEYDDRVLLIYFAITDSERGKGWGSKAIQLILEKYKDKRLYLEIESTKNTDAVNINTRIKRKGFYIKNGLTPLDYGVNLFGVDMEILTNRTYLSFDEYKELYTKSFSRLIGHKVKLLK